jgi:hypothetical protein
MQDDKENAGRRSSTQRKKVGMRLREANVEETKTAAADSKVL